MALFSIYWYFQGIRSLSEPGQYLLLARAIFTIGFYVTVVAMMFGRADGFATKPSALGTAAMMSMANMIQFVASSVFFAWCAWKIADSGMWRVVFIVRAITPLISSVFMVSWAYSWGQPQNVHLAMYGSALVRAALQLVVEMAAGVDDRRRARPRSSTHWAGLLLAIISDVLSIVSTAIYWSMRP